MAAISISGGCATIVTPDGERIRVGSDEFRAYAEAVFRRHNRATSELIQVLAVLEDDDPDAAKRLAMTEAEMMRACEPLDSLATAIRDRPGSRAGTSPGLRLSRSVSECDRATRGVETQLGELP